MKKKISVKSRLIALLLLCWALPLLIITAANSYYLASDRLESNISKEMLRLDFIDQNVMDALNESIQLSREASYDGVLLDNYLQFQKGDLARRNLLSNAQNYLRDHYSDSELIQMSAVWYRQDPQTLYANAVNSNRSSGYSDIKHYWKNDHEAIFQLTETLNTGVAFYPVNGRMYLVRNLYTRDYQNAATLVLLLDWENLFKYYQSLPEGAAVTLLLDDDQIQLAGEPVTPAETGLVPGGSATGYIWDRVHLCAYHQAETRDYSFTVLVRFCGHTISGLLENYSDLTAALILSIVPLMALLLVMYHKQIIQPLQQLMEGAERVARGEFGYQLACEPSSVEFAYLTSSFNSMSSRIQYQFEHIAREEIALRDARIKALQLHLNPHFMNNTLEIINWEARLSGNEKISKMIEALGTLMNAGMDRKNQRTIPLSEEMVYINAYLYIISERLGDRLTVINELPEDIMECRVPRLILQPVVENAIEHGVVRRGKGTVILYGRQEGKYLYLEILNEAVLTNEDQDKIRHLLDVNYDASHEPSGNIGISNVNQRLKILYGEPCGLTVQQVDEDHVCSKLTLLVDE